MVEWPATMAHTSLARTLRTTEYFTLAFGTMVGVGWLILIDDWLTRGGPAGAMLGFFLGGLALIPIAHVYGKFVHEMPDAASEIAYAQHAFPGHLGFLAGWLMTLAYLIVCPWEAVAIGRLLGYLIPSVESNQIYSVGGSPVFLPALVIGLALTCLIVTLNYRGIKISSRFQNYVTFAFLLLLGLFSFMGFFRSNPANFEPLFARPGARGALVSVILVLQIVPYFLTGFESVPKCAEEAHKDLQPRDFAKAIYLALIVGALFYVVIIGVVCGLAPWKSLTIVKFPTAVAFSEAFHSAWIVRLLLMAALFSLIKVFNGNFVAASRLIFALGRRDLIPSGMGRIHPRFQSPTNAVLFCGVVTAAGALMGRSILIPVTEVGSLCSALGWFVTCASYARTHPQDRKLAIAWFGGLIALLFVALKLVPQVPGSFTHFEYIALAVWLALGLTLRFTTKSQSPQRV